MEFGNPLELIYRQNEEILQQLRRLNEGNVETKENSTEFLTTKEAADFLKVTTQTIKNWSRSKKLRKHIGNDSIVRYLKSDLVELMVAV